MIQKSASGKFVFIVARLESFISFSGWHSLSRLDLSGFLLATTWTIIGALRLKSIVESFAMGKKKARQLTWLLLQSVIGWSIFNPLAVQGVIGMASGQGVIKV
jgi:hypothetical protein